MAKWTLKSQEPIRGESRRLVVSDDGREGFASVHHSTDGRPHLFGTVFLPRFDAEGMERGNDDGTPDVEVIDRKPRFRGQDSEQSATQDARPRTAAESERLRRINNDLGPIS